MKSSIFIITRFNLKLWGKDKNNQTTLSDKWLVNRFSLFKQYCFPYIKSQTYQDFIWLCLFDIDTPPIFKTEIDNMSRMMPNFHPCYLDETETKGVDSYISRYIQSHKEHSTNYLITCRLDNDDAVHTEYIEKLVELHTQQKENMTIYSFKYGMQYYTDLKLAFRIPYSNNHFLALIDNNFNDEDFKTILEYNHYYIKSCGIPFICINNHQTPMWIEVIHNENVDNDCKMTLRQRPIYKRNIIKKDFAIDIPENPKNIAYIITFFFIPRFMSQILRRIKNKIIH